MGHARNRFSSLLSKVYETFGVSRTLFHQTPAWLQELLDDAQSENIPQLIDFLNIKGFNALREVQITLDRLVIKLPPSNVHASDLRVRASLRYYSAPALDQFLKEPTLGIGTLFLAACSPDGRLRERALKRLSTFTSGQELPILLVRLGDWVPQVRSVAAAALIARVHDGYLEHWVRCLPVLERLRTQERGNDLKLMALIERLLALPAALPLLISALNDPDRLNRQSAFHALAHGHHLFEEQIRIALTSPDGTIRLLAAKYAKTTLKDQPLLRVLEKLKADRFPAIRREAIYGYAEQPIHTARQHLTNFLFDRVGGVRNAARFYLQRLDPAIDFRAVYHRAILERRELRVSILGLGETGTSDDVQHLWRFLSSADAMIRRAALQAISKLKPEDNDDAVLAALTDKHPTVSKAASDIILRSRRHLIDAGGLRNWICESAHAHVRRNVVVLANELNWWQSVPLILEALIDSDPGVQRAALQISEGWPARAGRAYRSPTSEELCAIRSAMVSAGLLSARVADDLNNVVDIAERDLRTRRR